MQFDAVQAEFYCFCTWIIDQIAFHRSPEGRVRTFLLFWLSMFWFWSKLFSLLYVYELRPGLKKGSVRICICFLYLFFICENACDLFLFVWNQLKKNILFSRKFVVFLTRFHARINKTAEFVFFKSKIMFFKCEKYEKRSLKKKGILLTDKNIFSIKR